MSRRLLLSWLFVLLLSVITRYAAATYNIGIGKSDITGPAAEVIMMGFASTDESDAGILNRLYARAFLIEDRDTSKRVVFVHCDLHSVMQLVHQEVLAQLATKYNGVYTEQNVILHATHTHAGPGGTAGYFLYDVSIFGYISENFDKIVSGIMSAIDAAHNSVQAGIIRWNKGEVSKGGKNRSPDAYLANPAAERAQYSSNIDTTMRALHFFSSSGKLRGVLAFYPVHPTSLSVENRLISGDNKGYAEFLLEDELDNVVVGIGIANAGDVSPNLIDNGDGTFSGEGNTTIQSAEIMGKRQYDTLSSLIKGASELIQGSVVANLSYVDFSNVALKGVTATTAEPYANRTCPAIVGQNFAAGTEDGRVLSMFTEGNLKANVLFQTIGGVIKETPQWVKDCQNVNKVPLLAVGLMEPVPWVPNILPVQVVKIGQFAIAVTNFETTTMAGRRIRNTVKTALAGAGVTEVELAAISNAYAQYMTTKEEYLTQNYEGASTLFGPNQLAAVQQELTRVAASVADSSVPLDVGPTPLQIDRTSLITLQTGVVVDSAPLLRSFSDVRTQPSSSYAVGSVASAVFAGAHPKNAITLVSSFCDVQKLGSNGVYTTVLTDAHWDLRYHWERYLIAESKNKCEWNIRKGGRTSVAGTYRFVHRGYSKHLLGALTAYEATSNSFTMTA
ncbi:Neutral ceramidase [Phytophthora cactorum]|uniref:Neutral ceramidase n=5 Tax=Phytophthora cactorum TaxID=29920 RepID=A0A329SV68_9STRA|nr:Neutral ceramidase [Phytophthora cactorum]RAW40993.1 Neutral ceramidase [Phytophthora cactorum]